MRTHEDRIKLFNDEEPRVSPETGYSERSVAWFEKNILPDFKQTQERLGLKGILLDIGCAYGYFTKHYAPLFQHVIGIDFAEKRIKQAQRVNFGDNINYAHFDLVIDELPWNADCAVSSAVFQHIDPTNDHRYKAFKSVRLALKPGAHFILYDECSTMMPQKWDGFYEALDPIWMSRTLKDIFDCEWVQLVTAGDGGEAIYRFELRAI